MGSARQFFIKCLEISAIYLCHSFSNNIVWFQFIGCNFTGNNVFGKNIQKQLLNADAEMLIPRFPLQDPRKASVRLLFHSKLQTAALRFADVNKQSSLRNFFTKENRIMCYQFNLQKNGFDRDRGVASEDKRSWEGLSVYH